MLLIKFKVHAYGSWPIDHLIYVSIEHFCELVLLIDFKAILVCSIIRSLVKYRVVLSHVALEFQVQELVSISSDKQRVIQPAFNLKRLHVYHIAILPALL